MLLLRHSLIGFNTRLVWCHDAHGLNVDVRLYLGPWALAWGLRVAHLGLA